MSEEMQEVQTDVQTEAQPEGQKKSLLTFKEKIGYLIFSTGFLQSNQAVENFILYFYTDVMKIGAGFAGAIGMIVTLFDAVNDPIIGHYSVNHKAKNGDSVRQHLLYSAVPFLVFYTLMWLAPAIPTWLKIVYALVVRCMLSIFSTFLRLPLQTMLHLSSPLKSDRIVMGEFNSVGCLIGYALSVIGFYPLVILFGGGANANGTALNEKRGFFLMGLLCAAVATMTFLLYYAWSKERVQDPRPDVKPSFKQNSVKLLKDKYWLRYTIFLFLANLTDTSILATMAYYCKYIVGNATFIIPIFITLLVSGAVATPLCKKIADKFGIKALLILGQGACTILAQIPLLLFPANRVLLIICGVFHGIKLAMTNTAIPIYTGIANDKIAKNNDGKRIDGMFQTVSGFFRKAASAIVTLLLGLCLSWGGYDGAVAVQSASAILMLKALFIFVPLFFGIVCLIYSIKCMDFEKENGAQSGAQS